MYHVGAPGEDGFTERILAAWGVDGHNSHTNICSSSARAGYHFWMGFDRPSPDHANAERHPADQRASRIGPLLQSARAARDRGQAERRPKLIVFDTRLSNTATHADHWVAPYPGSEAAILLAIANHLIQHALLQPRVRQAVVELGGIPGRRPSRRRADVREFRARCWAALSRLHVRVRRGANRASTPRGIEEIADMVATAGTRLSTHTWRSAAAGNAGGWQVSRALFMLNALMGAVATEGGTFPNAWNKFVPRPIYMPPHPPSVERADLAGRVSAGDERAVVPAAALAQGRARHGSTSTSRASTTRSGPIRTASPGSRC